MAYTYDDGGRAAAGYKGKTGDCVVRAVAIVTGLPYAEVYDRCAAINAGYAGRSRKAVNARGRRTARSGVWTRSAAFKRYMAELGFTWVPTMTIGSGCKVHLKADELPGGRIICALSRHYTAVIDGVIHDTYDPRDRGTTIYPPHTDPATLPKGAYWLENGNGWAYEPERCVYGYWTQQDS